MIRPMNQLDLDAVAALERICFTQWWTRDMLKSSFENQWDACFVSDEGGIITGFGIIRLLADEGEIQRIAVHPVYRGRGLGRELLEAMSAFAMRSGVRSIALEVRRSNTSARNLYKTNGFMEEAVRKGYYRYPTEDAIVMWRRWT